MFDKPPLPTATAASARRAELFDGAPSRLPALDSTSVDRCSRLTLAALIAAAILSAAVTAYIGLRGLPSDSRAPAPPRSSDAAPAYFSLL
jgi:hypothetical protein